MVKSSVGWVNRQIAVKKSRVAGKGGRVCRPGKAKGAKAVMQAKGNQCNNCKRGTVGSNRNEREGELPACPSQQVLASPCPAGSVHHWECGEPTSVPKVAKVAGNGWG